MNDQDLTPSMQELMAQISRMPSSVDKLKEKAQVLSQPASPAQPVLSTTRRNALRRLAGGLLAGAGMIGAAAVLPGAAEAKLTARAGRIGAIATANGDSTSNDLPSGTFKYGLLALSNTGDVNL